jgi:hypothetical protein
MIATVVVVRVVVTVGAVVVPAIALVVRIITFTFVGIKSTVFWGITPCRLVDHYRRFMRNTTSIFTAEESILKMEAACVSEMHAPDH